MKIFRQVIIALGVLVFISCDTSRSIDPFEDEAGSYSIYGAIELGVDNNFIRIRDVSVPFLADSGLGYENVNVHLEEVESGREIALRDTIVNYNGNYTVNYLIEEDLQPRVAYNFTIGNEFGEDLFYEYQLE